MNVTTASQAVDLTRWIKPGDAVWWGHGTSEPLALTEALMAQRAAIGRFSAFVGPTLSSTILPQHADHVTFSSYCAIGANQALYAAGALDLVPCHVSEVSSLLDEGVMRCDVVLIQLGRIGPDGKHRVAVSHDYLVGAAKQARVVIAEVNEAAPWAYGAHEFEGLRIDHVVRASHPVLTIASKKPNAVEEKIAENVAALIPDRAVVQTGIGTIPDAVLVALRSHRDLGVHSQIDRFFAINSAIEIDLSGQINAEVIGHNYVGAIGGQVDFSRGAIASKGGRSIIALPSTAANGTRSRIVVNLSAGIVTTARSDTDLVVTEWGVADLRGQSLRERNRRLIAIAHPDFREMLEKTAWPDR